MWGLGVTHIPPTTSHAYLCKEAFQRAGSGHVPKPRQRLLLELSDPFPRDAKLRADLLERHRLLAFEPEVQPEDSRLALLERCQHRLDRLGERVLEDLVVGTRIRRV